MWLSRKWSSVKWIIRYVMYVLAWREMRGFLIKNWFVPSYMLILRIKPIQRVFIKAHISKHQSLTYSLASRPQSIAKKWVYVMSNRHRLPHLSSFCLFSVLFIFSTLLFLPSINLFFLCTLTVTLYNHVTKITDENNDDFSAGQTVVNPHHKVRL